MSVVDYLIHVNLYLVVFYCFYKLLLDKETYFVLNRFYLTGSVVASFVIPALKLEWLTQETISRNLHIDIAGIVPQTELVEESNFTVWQALSVIYIAGILFSIVRLALNFLIVKKSIANPEKGTAFSFLGYKAIDSSLSDYNTINTHEEAHIKQMHSLDILLLEMAGIVTWFNPVIYLYKSSIRSIHEFLADKVAADYMGDKKDYAFLLLSKALNVNEYPLAHSFFKQSLVKKRVYMLQKQRSGKLAVFKYALVFPVVGCLIILSSATSFSKNDNTAAAHQFEQQPEFPGGVNKFGEYLRQTIKYPQQALKNEVEGRVVLSFTVNTDGSLTDFTIVKSVESSLDEEALRVLRNSPDWIPGSINGRPARVRYSLPLNFQLPQE